MSSLGTIIMLRINHYTNLAPFVNKFHTSSIICVDQGWRQKKGLVENPNTTGPLLNLPDYSFKDNKPVPYGSRQMGRIKKHQQYAKRIIQLVSEVDHAVEQHANLLKKQEERRKEILDSKLKPKGNQLIASE